MRISKIDCSKKSMSFGYNLPKYCDYKQSILTEDFIARVCQKKLAKSQAEYEKYMLALNNFKKKRFDARSLRNFYKPRMLNSGERGLQEWNELVAEFAPDTCTVMESKQVTREVKVKESFFRRFLNFIQGKPLKTEKITETVEKPVEYYDISKINAYVTEPEFRRYGSFFTGDNPPHDCYEISAEAGKESVSLARFSQNGNHYFDADESADKWLQASLSSAKSLDELGTQITEKLEQDFKSRCELILKLNGWKK